MEGLRDQETRRKVCLIDSWKCQITTQTWWKVLYCNLQRERDHETRGQEHVHLIRGKQRSSRRFEQAKKTDIRWQDKRDGWGEHDA